jgi:sporulation protein YlmC with PRC-barrel domain
VAFFSASNIAFRDAENLLPVTLNLQPIQGLEVQDCNGNTGIIDDVQVDFERNEVVNLVVQTSGDKAANRIVSAENLDLSTLTCNKEFSSCTELPFI